MRRPTLVLGAQGQLGGAMAAQLTAGCDVVALTRADLDVTAATAVRSAITSIAPEVIINCTAYTRVDEAEDHPLDALAVNAWAVGTLAEAASAIEATLVHFSTDFVFDGDTTRAYTEDDEANPRSVYAASKLVGEWLAAETPRHYVLRVESLFGGPHGASSVDRMFQALRAGTGVRAFVDRTVSPSYVDDVVAATAALLKNGDPYGVYHCVNSGWTTWSGIAHELARLIGRPKDQVVEIPMTDAVLRAPRPQHAALSNAKLAERGISMPSWQDALTRYVAERSPVVPPSAPSSR